MNRLDYTDKVTAILNKDNLFHKVHVEDPLKHTILIEDKLNRNLKSWLNKGFINNEEYKDIYVTGTRPGILYGLPKIHKQGTPVRPVLSARKTPIYNLSKFLIQFLEPYTHNEFTLKNSGQLIDELKNVQLNNESYMVSFDIESLYTNIPVKESIDIALNQIINNNDASRNIERI